MKRSRAIGLPLAVSSVVVISLLAMACGSTDSTEGGGEGESQGGETTTGAGAVAAREGVQDATVLITTRGTMTDLTYGTQETENGGSGFIIDGSGIAVTNNHVVTGAAALQVLVGGEGDPLNAEVLGRSECSDLAVIDIDGGGYPYLEWYNEEVQSGIDVYAAGFPNVDIEDPQFTLTGGIISKEPNDVDSSWASVDQAIEHDVRINPGSSGGPLVEDNGRVVGVNYAAYEETEQSLAVAPDEALDIISQLRNRQNVNSIGVNGEAFVVPDEDPRDGVLDEDEELEFSGIGVRGIQPGSSADKAGVRPGDVITRLGGITLVEDVASMGDYCDVLRTTPDPKAVIDIEVYRFEGAEDGQLTGGAERLEGQLNGRPLEVKEEVDPMDESASGEGAGDASVAGFTPLTDDTGALSVEVPSAWNDVQPGFWEFVEGNENVGPAITASPDIEKMVNFEESGIYMAASSALPQEYTADQLLDLYDYSGDCQYGSREEVGENANFTGKFDIWTDCRGTGAQFLVYALLPKDGGYTSLIQVTAKDEAALEETSRVVDTIAIAPENL